MLQPYAKFRTAIENVEGANQQFHYQWR